MIKAVFYFLAASGLFLVHAFHAGAVTGAVSGGYHVDNGDTATITAHSVQKKVTNNHISGLSIYVPLNSALEWSTFVANPPAGVLVATPCGGVTVGGYCWYLGSANQNCNTVCTSRGGCNLAGTAGYAGNTGTLAQCQSVLTALGVGAVPSNTSTPNGTGCVESLGYAYRLTSTTTCAAAYTYHARACACNN